MNLRPHGFLFDKEAIFEYIVHKKVENMKRLKAFEKQKRKDEDELAELAKAEERSKTESFLKMEKSIITSEIPSTSVGSRISNMSEGKDKKLPSFWIPAMTPNSNKTKIKKPDDHVLCPMSGRPLKAKDLMPVSFTPIDSNSSESLISRKVLKLKYCILVNNSLKLFLGTIHVSGNT